jgi:hypothetical protein
MDQEVFEETLDWAAADDKCEREWVVELGWSGDAARRRALHKTEDTVARDDHITRVMRAGHERRLGEEAFVAFQTEGLDGTDERPWVASIFPGAAWTCLRSRLLPSSGAED